MKKKINEVKGMNEQNIKINIENIGEFERAIERATNALAEFGKGASEISKVKSAFLDNTTIISNFSNIIGNTSRIKLGCCN